MFHYQVIDRSFGGFQAEGQLLGRVVKISVHARAIRTGANEESGIGYIVSRPAASEIRHACGIKQ